MYLRCRGIFSGLLLHAFTAESNSERILIVVNIWRSYEQE